MSLLNWPNGDPDEVTPLLELLELLAVLVVLAALAEAVLSLSVAVLMELCRDNWTLGRA